MVINKLEMERRQEIHTQLQKKLKMELKLKLQTLWSQDKVWKENNL